MTARGCILFLNFASKNAINVFVLLLTVNTKHTMCLILRKYSFHLKNIDLPLNLSEIWMNAVLTTGEKNF